jgi:hypothetical protein
MRTVERRQSRQIGISRRCDLPPTAEDVWGFCGLVAEYCGELRVDFWALGGEGDFLHPTPLEENLEYVLR